MTNSRIGNKLLGVAVVAMAFFVTAACFGSETANVVVTKQNNTYSIQANHAPLLKVLSELGGHIEAHLFLADSIAASPVDVHCKNVTLVQALRSILKNFDFAASFSKNAQGEDYISLVKIYPKGDRTGNLIKVAAASHNSQKEAVGLVQRGLGGEHTGVMGGKSPFDFAPSPQGAGGQSLGQTGRSSITSGPAIIAKRDLNQALDQRLYDIAQHEWSIQHSPAVALPDSGASSNSPAPTAGSGTSSNSLAPTAGSGASNTNASASTPASGAGSSLAAKQLADVVSKKVQAETMQENVNAGLNRLQFLQQKDATSFVVTVASPPATSRN